MLKPFIEQLIQNGSISEIVIDNRYLLVCKLGKGRFGKVILCKDIFSNQLTALKYLQRKLYGSHMKHFLAEINILIDIWIRIKEELRLTNILDFNLSGKDNMQKPYVYYTMRFVERGDLFKLIENKRLFDENMLSNILYQIIYIVNELQQRFYFHFDIKPENILIDKDFLVYICDFGSCLKINSENKLQSWRVNHTPEYCSPEILFAMNKSQNMQQILQENDLAKIESYSLGVTLFVLLFHKFPFTCQSYDYEYLNYICNQKRFWELNQHSWTISLELKNLIENLLQPIADQRISLSQALDHPWFQLNFDQNENGFEEYFHEEELNMITFIKRYQKRLKQWECGNLHKYLIQGEIQERFAQNYKEKIFWLKTKLDQYLDNSLSSVSNISYQSNQLQ